MSCRQRSDCESNHGIESLRPDESVTWSIRRCAQRISMEAGLRRSPRLKRCVERGNLVGDLGTSFISTSLQSSRSSVSLCRTRSRHRQRVTPFVIRLPGVSSDVYPRHLVVADQLLELLPQIPIHHWLSSGGSPAVGLPSRKELGDSPAYIVGVGQHGDLAGTLQSPQPLKWPRSVPSDCWSYPPRHLAGPAHADRTEGCTPSLRDRGSRGTNRQL